MCFCRSTLAVFVCLLSGFLTFSASSSFAQTGNIVDCGDNLGFEDGDLNGWNGCYFSGCPVGKTYTDFNACSNECGNCSPQTTGGTITYTCTSCSGGASPTKSPCCPIKCDQTGLKPGVNSVNGTLGNCSVLAPTPGNVRHTVTTGNGLDPNSDGNIPVVAPNGGGFSVRIGNQEAGWESECLSRSFVVTQQNVLFTYLYAVVFMDPPGHDENNRPRFEITITDNNGDLVECGGEYTVVSTNASQQGFKLANNPNCGRDSQNNLTDVWYKEWTPVATDLSPYMGQQVTIKFCTADCGQGGHWGYAYVDTYCNPFEIKGAKICTTGDDVTLVAPDGFTNYQWFNGSTSTPPVIGTNQTLVVPPDDGAIYTVQMENVASPGCYTYATDTIVVFSADALGDTLVCEFADPVQLNAEGSHDGTTYDWTPTNGLSCTTCPNPIVNPPFTTTTYTVTMQSPYGCTLVEEVTITAQPCPPSVTATADTLCEGGCGDVQAFGVDGVPPYTYTWSPNIGTEAGPYNLCPTTTTTYNVTVTDVNGDQATNSTTFVIYPVPTVTMTPDMTICSDDIPTSDLTATVNGGTAPFDYIWDDPGSGTTPTITVNNVLNTTVTYNVSITDVNGCTTDGEVTVISTCTPVVSLQPDTFCVGGCATLQPDASGGAPPYTFTWDDPNLTGPGPHSVCPPVTTTYCVTVTDINGETGNACTTIIVNNPPVLSTTVVAAICGECNGEITVVPTGNGPYLYNWDSGCTTATCTGMCPDSYAVTVTDANGCVDSISDEVPGFGTPTIQVTDSTDPVCYGDCTGTATSVVTDGTPPYNYAWSDAGSQSTATASGLCAGTYTVCVTDDLGCTDCDLVTINQPPPVTLTTGATDEICHDSSGTVYVVPGGGTAPYTVVWNDVNGSTTDTIRQLAEGNYAVTVTDANGCILTGNDVVSNVQILPFADFVPDPNPALLMNPVISFFDKSSDAISWEWDFGDSSVSTLQNPVHTYVDTGCYVVKLYIENQYGCRDTIPQTVCVRDISSIYIPNAFSPNGDGVNEYFTVGEYNYCDFEMYIFDRWGNLIFKTTNLKGWDGTANNGADIAQEDVYVWLVKAVDCYGNEWKRVGQVTIVR